MARCEALPPVSLLLPAVFLGEVRGLPLEEFCVSDGAHSATVLRRGGRYFLPLRAGRIDLRQLCLTDSGVDILLSACRVFDTDFLILRCDDLSLLDKRLAPRLLTKTAADAFIAYEIRDGKIEFFAYSHRSFKGLLPTAACVLYFLSGIKNISRGSFSPELRYIDGLLCLSAKPYAGV